MARLILAIALFVVATTLIPGGQASSLRARSVHARNKAPTDSFRKNFGWPGFSFPGDRWGVVMNSPEAEEAAAAAASASIVSPNLGTIPVNIAPSPVSNTPSPIFSALTIISSVPQAVPTSATGLSDIPVSNSTPSASSSSAVPRPTTHSVTPLAVAHPSSSSVIPIPPASSNSTRVASQTSSSILTTHSSFVSPSSSPAPSHSSSASSAPPASHSQAPPPSVSTQPPSPVNVGAAPSQGNQGGGSDNSNPSESGSGPTSPSDIQAYLTAHNTVRAQHGAAALTYSQSLAAKAQQWANGCVFKHSGGSLGPFGENLAAGTGNGYGISQAIQSWTAEVSQYNPNNPQPSHFTQVVWKSTTEVGCAVQDCSGIFPSSFGLAHYYVCEYSPQGNVIGEFPANVQV